MRHISSIATGTPPAFSSLAKKTAFGLMVCLSVVGAVDAHDYYASFGSAEVTRRTLTATMNVNALDFIEVLQKMSGGKSLSAMSLEEFRGLMLKYLKLALRVYANGKEEMPLLLGEATQGGGSIVFTVSCSTKVDFDSLRIENEILINEFPQQQNILNVSTPTAQKTLQFDAENRVAALQVLSK